MAQLMWGHRVRAYGVLLKLGPPAARRSPRRRRAAASRNRGASRATWRARCSVRSSCSQLWSSGPRISSPSSRRTAGAT